MARIDSLMLRNSEGQRREALVWCLARVALPGNRVSVGSLVVVVRLFGMAMRDPSLMKSHFGYGVRREGEI